MEIHNQHDIEHGTYKYIIQLKQKKYFYDFVYMYTEPKLQALVAKNFFSSWKSKRSQQQASVAANSHTLPLLLHGQRFHRLTSYPLLFSLFLIETKP